MKQVEVTNQATGNKDSFDYDIALTVGAVVNINQKTIDEAVCRGRWMFRVAKDSYVQEVDGNYWVNWFEGNARIEPDTLVYIRFQSTYSLEREIERLREAESLLAEIKMLRVMADLMAQNAPAVETKTEPANDQPTPNAVYLAFGKADHGSPSNPLGEFKKLEDAQAAVRDVLKGWSILPRCPFLWTEDLYYRCSAETFAGYIVVRMVEAQPD